jgi:hypothetical protein
MYMFFDGQCSLLVRLSPPYEASEEECDGEIVAPVTFKSWCDATQFEKLCKITREDVKMYMAEQPSLHRNY